MDTFSREKRHEIMSKIRSKDTKIEVMVSHWLYHHGVRYRNHCKDVFGKPDITIKKYKIAIFINGCFWHGHENCKGYRLPKSNIEYWQRKIKRNMERDQTNLETLQSLGWYVFIIWECQAKLDFENVMNNLFNQMNEIKKS